MSASAEAPNGESNPDNAANNESLELNDSSSSLD